MIHGRSGQGGSLSSSRAETWDGRRGESAPGPVAAASVMPTSGLVSWRAASQMRVSRYREPPPFSVRIERSRDAPKASTPDGCLDFARHERLEWEQFSLHGAPIWPANSCT